MEAVTFQGTENQLVNLTNAIGFTDNDMPQKVETRVYVMEVDSVEKHHSELTDEEFQDLAEEQGRVYTLEGFQEAFNYEEVSSAIDIVRFINVVIN